MISPFTSSLKQNKCIHCIIFLNTLLTVTKMHYNKQINREIVVYMSQH